MVGALSEIWMGLYKELKSAPMTLLIIGILSYVVWGLSSDHVSVAQFQSLQTELRGVVYTLKHDHVDTRLHQTETELFNVTQHINEERAKGRDVDNLYNLRLDELTQEDNELKREMAGLEARR
jgi:hypothetical protein